MKAMDFLKTRWGELAKTSEDEATVRKEFQRWVEKTKNTTLAKRGRQLWEYFNSGRLNGAEKALVIAALLYLISPVDLVPDWIPVAGLLDDVGVATLVLDFLLKRMNEKQGGKESVASEAGEDKPKSKVGHILKAVAKLRK